MKTKTEGRKPAQTSFDKAWVPFIDSVHAEAFPGPARDADDVGLLMKKMFVNKLALQAFTAGWVAAGGEVPR